MRKIEIRLKQILKDRNMLQKELAELAEVSPNAISMLARGHVSHISVEILEKILNVLEDVELTDIIVVKEIKEADPR